MASQFPIHKYLDALTKLFDTINYKDENYVFEDRLERMRVAYQAASRHFAQPHIQSMMSIAPKRLEKTIRTICGMVVACWVQADLDLTALLAIYYTYIILLDDSNSDPHKAMGTFVEDLVQGDAQKHPWWQLINDQFPELLKHYGPFCGLNIYRGTLDFFQGCWIEQHNFGGYEGAHEYPDFLRRLNGVGHGVGATVWPANKFDESKLFREITTTVCMLGQWEVWVNDLLSFWKEFDDADDQNTLINNYMSTEGITIEGALEKLTINSLDITERMIKVFADKDENVRQTITKFVHGYVTWHLTDKRYRMVEFYDLVKKSEAGQKFKQYFESAPSIAPEQWAIPAAPPLETNVMG